MPLHVLLVASVLAADPITVSLSSKRAGAEAYAAKVAAKVRGALATQGVQVGSDDRARDCQGATECVASAAKQLGGIVVGVDVGHIAKSLAIHLEAVEAGATEPLAVADLSATATGWSTEITEPLEAFARKVIEKLPKAAPVAQATTPPPTRELPEVTAKPVAPPPPPVEEQSESSNPGPLRWITTAVAVASLAAGGVCLGLGLQEKSIIDASITPAGLSTLMQSEYNLHRSRGNAELTIALTTLIVGAVLAITTAILFAAQ